MMNTERLRHRYRPEAITILFIGEAPPYRGTFFYDDERPSKLRRVTEGVLREVLADRIGLDFLASFSRVGCYLDDLSLEPIDQLPDEDRMAARLSAEPLLAKRMERGHPRFVVGIGLGCQRSFRRAHAAARLDTPLEILPFPNWPREVRRYEDGLVALVRRCDRLGLLLP
jgi:hypothetical protein